eukprot:CAMPEP_0113955490 /NCGR_PEP_ID=MMETSP0011_2-20120614/1375_1 /TAXON_ID=101924 /ORGANISM="Rhodosorus marinus" /LENGTH=127 /DNA_ID=CAMNT_0000965211 /DNA_START=280 /DNA_END=660 /DNA_ORIENTATION=- /assembly_acc=CAM_ASM_000156
MTEAFSVSICSYFVTKLQFQRYPSLVAATHPTLNLAANRLIQPHDFQPKIHHQVLHLPSHVPHAPARKRLREVFLSLSFSVHAIRIFKKPGRGCSPPNDLHADTATLCGWHSSSPSPYANFRAYLTG